MKNKNKILILLVIFTLLLVTSCQGKTSAADANATQTAQAILFAMATEMKATADSEPTVTMTAEPTAVPTLTPRPTSLPPTPTLDMPVSAQTPIPNRDIVIDRSNAADVKPLALFGQGTIEEISVSPSGRWVAAATISGISIYETGAENYAQHFLTNQSVRSVDFSPNGEMVAGGLQTGELVVVSVADGAILYRLTAHEDSVLAVEYSPDGKYLATGSADGNVKIFDAETLQQLQEIEAHTGRVNDLAWSPDSTTVASASADFYTRLWNVDGDLVEEFLYQNGSITSVTFSADGKYIATGSADFTVFIRNLVEEDTLPIVLENDNIVRTISFTSDTKQIAIGGDDYGVDIWELFADDGTYQGYLLKTLNHDYTVISAEFLPDDETLVTATWGSLLSWWDVPNRETTQTIDRGFLISAGIFDGNPIILSEPTIGTIEVYNADTLQNILTIKDAHPSSVYQAALSPDQAWLVTASYDGFRVWDMATGDMAYEGLGYPGYVSALRWSKGSELLGVGFNNGDVVLFDPTTLVEETLDISRTRILAIDFSSDLNIVASGGDDNTVTLWRRTDGTVIATLKGHIDTIYDIAFSPDSSVLASASSDYSVNIWQGVTGNTEDYGKYITSLEDHTFRVKSVCFSPDGSLIASIADDGTAIIWDAENGERLATLEGFTGYAKTIAFSPDGTLLYTFDWDGVMRVFGITVE